MKQGERVGSRKMHRGLGIHGKILLFLTSFVLLVLFLIWLFQIHLLGMFYERTKYDVLDRVASEISYFLNDEESLETAVYDYSTRYDLCISVYRVGERGNIELCRSHNPGVCAVHQLSDEERATLCEDARVNNGSLSVTYTIERQFFERNPNAEGEFGDANGEEEEGSSVGEEFPESNLPIDAHIVTEECVNAVSAHIVKTSNRTEYILLLDSELTPVSSLVDTLELQFLWIAAILLALALLLAFVISTVVLRPVASMNESAKRLARGDYRVVFRGKGFRESRELADTLNYAAHELSLNDNLQKELIANISHDLRTPLTMIKGYSEAMRDIPGENTPENMQVVIDEAERMSALVSDLLDLSKIQSGNRIPVSESFDLTEVIQDTLFRYEKLKERDGYTIHFVPVGEAYVYADRTMILQVIYNLINNAVNYTGEDKSVTVSEVVTERDVRIMVSDTGEGIPRERLSLIWDRYYKVDRVHKRATVGTGLGLAIVKEILEMHGATYGVDSTLGKGSTFWFSLPLCAAPEAEKTDGKGEIEP